MVDLRGPATPCRSTFPPSPPVVVANALRLANPGAKRVFFKSITVFKREPILFLPVIYVLHISITEGLIKWWPARMRQRKNNLFKKVISKFYSCVFKKFNLLKRTTISLITNIRIIFKWKIPVNLGKKLSTWHFYLNLMKLTINNHRHWIWNLEVNQYLLI